MLAGVSMNSNTGDVLYDMSCMEMLKAVGYVSMTKHQKSHRVNIILSYAGKFAD